MQIAKRATARAITAYFGQIKRFDAKPIAGEHDPTAVAFMNCEGKHPVETFDTVEPPSVRTL